jgi:putative tryptophan/tyrosine transport system substrate-binding protein
MRRRAFITLVGGAVALPMGVRAQETGKVYRIGYLGFGTAIPQLQEIFRQGLRELGWREGHNIFIEYRYAEGRYDLLPGLAYELIQLKVDIIVASPTPAAMAAKEATQTIPIVGVGLDNPVQHGLIASLAHPGGNVTGLSYGPGPELFGKDLELVRELIPGLRHVAVLSNSVGPNHGLMISNVNAAAQSLGVSLLLLDVHGPDEFDGAFVAMARERVGALFVYGDPMFSVHRVRLAELAAQNRLPTIHTNRLHVEAGGLMCYGPSFSDLWRRAASYVDKLLKGAKPNALPVEQPTKFELVINLKTAKALGLTIPESILLQATDLIE